MISENGLPLISIITLTYNHGRFISQCIESVLVQTYPCWEMVVVDDASEDDTYSRANAYARRDERIKTVRHENNWGMYRLAESYNQALALSRGGLIAVLEGDDFWPEDKLEKQMRLFEDPDIVLSYGRYDVISYSGRTLATEASGAARYYRRFYDDYKGYVFMPLLLKPCFIAPVTVMIRKKALQEIGGFLQLGDITLVDHPTFLRLAFEGQFFGSSEVLGYYRKHASSQTLQRIVETTRKEKEIAFSFLDFVASKGLAHDPGGVKKKMRKSWTRETVLAHWMEGRRDLAAGKQSQASRAFWKGMKSGDFPDGLSPGILFRKLACFLGAVASVSGLPFEKLINFGRGRKTSVYESLREEMRQGGKK